MCLEYCTGNPSIHLSLIRVDIIVYCVEVSAVNELGFGLFGKFDWAPIPNPPPPRGNPGSAVDMDRFPIDIGFLSVFKVECGGDQPHGFQGTLAETVPSTGFVNCAVSLGHKFFIFMHFSGKIGLKVCWRPLHWEILDPPLPSTS